MAMQEQNINSHLLDLFVDKIYNLIKGESYKEIKIKYFGTYKIINIIDIIEVSLTGENKELQLQYFYVNHDTLRLFAKLKDIHSCVSEEYSATAINGSKFIENIHPKSIFSEIDLSIINNINMVVAELLQSFGAIAFKDCNHTGKIEILFNFLKKSADFKLLTQYEQNKKFIFQYGKFIQDSNLDECFYALTNMKNNNKILLKDLSLYIYNSQSYEFKNEDSGKHVKLILLNDLFKKIFKLFYFYKDDVKNKQRIFQNKNFLMILDLNDREKFLFTFYDALHETVIKDDIELTFKITDY